MLLFMRKKIQESTMDNVPFSKSLFAHKPHFEEQYYYPMSNTGKLKSFLLISKSLIEIFFAPQ